MRLLYNRSGGVGGAVSPTLLLPMTGTNGSTTFTDSSVNAVPITAFTPAQISTAQSKFGGSSAAFTGDFTATLGQGAITAPSSSLFDFGSGDFTVEMFIRLGALTTVSFVSHGLICKRATTAVFAPFNLEATYTGGPTRLKGQVSTSGSSWITCQSADNLSINTWYHIALCRSGTNLRMFLDGIQADATQTVSGALMINSDAVSIGAASVARDYGMNGFIDDLRITKGYAYYTSNFTPPTAPF